ncbi:MAG TPA: glycosyltransferase family 39 protein [Verrucomicrobiae bacterium]|nr:glycosyltransferase family 39 protein [Verrucomicrobiae bacterium]
MDQILRAQIWNLGYGPQPPLYTWLTKLFLGAFGYNVLSMLLLKELIIFSIYAVIYAAAHRLTGSHLHAVLATVLLQANFSIAWEAHRELTHTVLLSALAAATVWAFIGLERDRWRPYLVLGICSGLGMLAKYNFALVWLALFLAALSLRDLRPLLFNRKMLVALLLMVALCAPHFIWVARHPVLAFSSVPKLKMATPGDWSSVAQALGKWIMAILAHAGPMVALVALAFVPEMIQRSGGQASLPVKRRFELARGADLFPSTFQQQLLVRTLLFILILVTANIIIFRVTGVRDRYVQPFFVWLPVLLVGALPRKITARAVRFFLPLAGLGAVVVALVAPGRILLTESLKKNEILNTPFRKLAMDLKSAVERADCIVAENHRVAGNLRLWFPTKLVLDPEVAPLFQPAHRKTLLVWESNSNAQPPTELLRFVRSFNEAAKMDESRTVEELLKYHHVRTIRLGVALVE